MKMWISAARLRTLPLSLSGIFLGTALAISEGFFDAWVFGFAILTTLGLQVLSNFANDYGDGVKGTDNTERAGPMRALQSGIISRKEMKKAILWTSVVTFAFALVLIYHAFGAQNFLYSILFLVMGIAAIIAAIKYTVGDTAYGYRGLGDVFVFVFFGLVSVMGIYFMYTHQLHVWILLPAVSVGLLSTAVLNLNNLRDQKGDKQSGKNTLVVKLGAKKAKYYHYFLIFGALTSMLLYYFLRHSAIWEALCLIAFIPLLIHVKTVFDNTNPGTLDPELKKVSLSTFALALLYFFTVVLI